MASHPLATSPLSKNNPSQTIIHTTKARRIDGPGYSTQLNTTQLALHTISRSRKPTRLPAKQAQLVVRAARPACKTNALPLLPLAQHHPPHTIEINIKVQNQATRAVGTAKIPSTDRIIAQHSMRLPLHCHQPTQLHYNNSAQTAGPVGGAVAKGRHLTKALQHHAEKTLASARSYSLYS